MHRYSQSRHSSKKHFSLSALQYKLKHLNRGALLKNVVLAGLAAGLFGAICILGLFAWYSKDLPDPDALLTREVPQSTKIYDRTGEHILYEIALDEKRTLVTIDKIPLYLQEASITAEDRRFYEHHGFSVKGLARALLFQGNRGGGSTITQQLVKNAILTNEQKLSRKIKELIMSVALEQRYSKEQILQMYFNEIPYGSTNYGVESAAQTYFGKHVEDVTLSEAATLAGLPQRPSAFLNNLDLLKERRDWILQGMVDEGYLSQEEADAAMAEEISINVNVANIEAPHFVLWVKSLLEEKYGSREVETGGLKVVTSLDVDKQKIAEEAISNGVTAYGATYGFTNAGLVSIDPKTGQIVAMVGSPDYWNDEIDGQVNVTLRPLQPGSSIKPIVYAAAFERGYTPNTILWDVNTVFSTVTGPYEPKNYDLQEHGYVTMRKALQGSLNIPAVKVLYLVGIDYALNFAQRMGYTTLNDASKVGLSMVLGGAEVKLLDHTSAYATFANNGIRHEPVAILRVESGSGEVLEEWKEENNPGDAVINPAIAHTISDVLADNGARSYVFGPSSYLQLGDRPSAAKSGTTNDYNDAWTMGYTPSLVAGVWVGNADGKEMKRGADGSKVAAPIWSEYMKRSLQGTPVEGFTKPQIPVTGKFMLDGKLPATIVEIDRASGKLATALTPNSYRETKACGEYHTILHYVLLSDPRGPVPADPAKADSSYTNWENSVKSYVERHNANLKPDEVPLENCVIPTEEDDVHTKRNEPEVQIQEPDNNQDVDRTFTTRLNIESNRSFSRVEYYIDGALIGSSSSRSGNTVTLPGWVDAGTYVLEVVAYDDVDNSGRDSVKIRVSEAGSAGDFRITNPFNGQTIEKTGAGYNIAIEVPNASNYRSLQVIAQNLWTGTSEVIGTVQNPTAITQVTWNLALPAEYYISATATTQSGNVEETSPVKVLVKDPVSGGIPIE